MYGSGLGVRKVYEIHTVLFAVDGLVQLALLAVVNYDLVIFAARYDIVTGGREVETVDLIRVLTKHFGHFEATNDVVHQLHLYDHGNDNAGQCTACGGKNVTMSGVGDRKLRIECMKPRSTGTIHVRAETIENRRAYTLLLLGVLRVSRRLSIGGGNDDGRACAWLPRNATVSVNTVDGPVAVHDDGKRDMSAIETAAAVSKRRQRG